ncbi:MAG: hypothetical protein OJF47_001008 [Nitrospira sp.]|nr:MAG: hypothetical protein OJF47_001008 [Nitrospira sp.]
MTRAAALSTSWARLYVGVCRIGKVTTIGKVSRLLEQAIGEW